MQPFPVQRQQLVRVEARGGFRDIRQVVAGREIRRHARHRIHAGAQREQVANQRRRLHPVAPQLAQADAAGALRQRPAIGIRQQRQMGEAHAARMPAECRQDIQLDRRVGHMILAPDHIGDPGLEVIDDGGEGIEEAAIGTDQDRVRQARQLHLARAQHAVAPFHRIMGQLEAPMRLLAIGDGAVQLVLGHLQRGAVVDRRLALAAALFALELQLLLGLEAGVEPAGGLQLLRRHGITVQPFGLGQLLVPIQAEPAEVFLDRGGVFGLGSLGVGVVQPQQEAPAPVAGEAPIGQRDARIADMQEPRGRGRETDLHRRDRNARRARKARRLRGRSVIIMAQSGCMIPLWQGSG